MNRISTLGPKCGIGGWSGEDLRPDQFLDHLTAIKTFSFRHCPNFLLPPFTPTIWSTCTTFSLNTVQFHSFRFRQGALGVWIHLENDNLIYEQPLCKPPQRQMVCMLRLLFHDSMNTFCLEKQNIKRWVRSSHLCIRGRWNGSFILHQGALLLLCPLEVVYS